MKIIRIVIVLFLLQTAAFAFNVPERLEYDLNWIGINAGTAVLSINKFKNNYMIESRAQSNRFVSAFYKVDDKITCIVDNSNDEFGPSLHYRTKIREGRHKRDKEIVFDPDTGKATYINHRKNRRRVLEIWKNSFDPLSAFYSVRKKDLRVGETVTVNIFDSKKMWSVKVEILRKEKVKVPAGVFNAIVIKPIMMSEGIFKRKGDVFIWITDDEKKIPVKVKSEVTIGHIAAELTGGVF